MTRMWSDMTPEAERVFLDLLREATPARKLELVGELNETVRLLARSGLRSRFPNASEDEITRRLADIVLGPELASKVYGPMLSEQGDTRAVSASP